LVNSPPGQSAQIVTTVVFRKLIDRTGLETRARETGNSPTLLSPDGTHRQQLTNLELIPPDLLGQVQAAMRTSPPIGLSAYGHCRKEVVLCRCITMQFENRPRLILSLAATRDSTLQKHSANGRGHIAGRQRHSPAERCSGHMVGKEICRPDC